MRSKEEGESGRWGEEVIKLRVTHFKTPCYSVVKEYHEWKLRTSDKKFYIKKRICQKNM